MPATRRRRSTRKPARRPRRTAKYWSQRVTRFSNALDLDRAIFTWRDPKRVARSLKRSAESSTRRRAAPYQSAMSMLNFYINRAGRGLPAAQKKVLQRAKLELRKLYHRA